MLIYTDHVHEDDGPGRLREVAAAVERLASVQRPGHDELVEALIGLGVFESAVADVLCPDEDAPHPLLAMIRSASESLGLAVAASWHSAGAAGALHSAASALAHIDPAAVPSRIARQTPEGYAFYAVYPEAYVEAVTEWVASRRPGQVVCLGLRSIGTSLSAVVHGALRLARVESMSWTLRPRGHPFDRHIVVAQDLVRAWPSGRATFLIVDEGPGMSGSSLAGTAAALAAHGIPDDRIVLMAAWRPDPAALRSTEAQRRWPRHTVLTAPFDRVRRRVFEAAGIPHDATEVSAGRWRSVLRCPRPWPAVQPQHERMKLATADGWIVRFAGLGELARQARARAERLASRGWTTPPGAIGRGFLALRFAPGEPIAPPRRDGAFLHHAAAYVAWLRRHEATGAAASNATLAEMLRINARESLGDDAATAAERLIHEARSFNEPAVAIDGRLLPHEWIATPNGFVKTDALDHHRDHFLPGPTDAAWDLAGLIVENGLSGAARDVCLATYVRESGDTTAPLRLPFFLAAYAAFRVGYCAMAQPLVDAEEAKRFTSARTRYEDALKKALIPSS